MSAVALDVAAVRARFSALENELVFFDGPGGSQVPDEVIEAIADYLRTSNANVSGPYATSRRTEALVDDARRAGGEFLGCSPEEVVFGANMTTLNFALSRTVGRELEAGDEIVVTQLDHDGNVSPWLELARDLDLKVRVAAIHDDTSLDLDDLEAQLSDRTRVVAFPGRRTRSARSSTWRGWPSWRIRPGRSPGWTPCTTRRTGRSTSMPSAPTF